MNVTDAARFFDAIAPRYDRVYARPADELRARMTGVLEWIGPAPRDVLDLGVGTGRELHHLLDAGHRVTGVDVSAEMLALCNQRSRKIPCVRADFWHALPFADASFDAVIALFGSLAHAPDAGAHARLASEAARVLRPGGTFYAEVPTASWAASHPTFEDESSGARIAITAPSEAAWRDALHAFDVTTRDDGAELTLAGKLR